MLRKRPPTRRRYVSYLDLKLKDDPRYVEKLIPAVLDWEEIKNNEERKQKINEDKFKNAFYKVKSRGSFNRNEFVSAFKHAEARGNVNVNAFVKHYLRRRTRKRTVPSRNNRTYRTKNVSL